MKGRCCCSRPIPRHSITALTALDFAGQKSIALLPSPTPGLRRSSIIAVPVQPAPASAAASASPGPFRPVPQPVFKPLAAGALLLLSLGSPRRIWPLPLLQLATGQQVIPAGEQVLRSILPEGKGGEITASALYAFLNLGTGITANVTKTTARGLTVAANEGGDMVKAGTSLETNLPSASAAEATLDGTERELTIAANNATGNPDAIVRGYGSLSGTQADALAQLPEYGSSTIVGKRFGLNDLAALTAETGDEFAMFTTGGRRVIFREDAATVPINPAMAEDLAAQGWRWSAHTHPGDLTALPSSVGDRAALLAMPQGESVILNSFGQWRTFTPAGDSLRGWKP